MGSGTLENMGTIVDRLKPEVCGAEQPPLDCTGASRSASGSYTGTHWCRGRGGTLKQKSSRSSARMRWTTPLEITAKEYVWLWERRRGVDTKAIANRSGVSVRRVRFGIARAKESRDPTQGTLHPPKLIPLFPIGPYTPQSVCGHRLPIQAGSLLCCMVCHCSGMDGHPALQRDVGKEPIRETVASVHQGVRENRRLRRLRIFGSNSQRARVTTE
jgi:hypothetical protein